MTTLTLGPGTVVRLLVLTDLPDGGRVRDGSRDRGRVESWDLLLCLPEERYLAGLAVRTEAPRRPALERCLATP